MSFVWNVLRVYSWIFETVLCGMGLLLVTFSVAASNVSVRVPWLLWQGPNQMRWVGFLAIFGLISVVLAVLGRLRILFFLFSGIALFVLVRGLFLNSSYTFRSHGELHNALLLVIGALLAFVGSLPLRPRKRR